MGVLKRLNVIFLRLLLVFRAICGNTFAACGFCIGYYHLTSCERDVFLLASRWETYHCIFFVKFDAFARGRSNTSGASAKFCCANFQSFT